MDHSDYFSGYEKPIVLLEDWSVVPANGWSPYQAPEAIEYSLWGKVTKHPIIEDGEYIHTTPAVTVNGLEVETNNTIYVLGKMNADYAIWCVENGIDIDPSNPFGGSY